MVPAGLRRSSLSAASSASTSSKRGPAVRLGLASCLTAHSGGIPDRRDDGQVALEAHQRTGEGFRLQISSAYSAMVRSLENLPLRATLMIALRVHASRSS